jgi:hypothetical protein
MIRILVPRHIYSLQRIELLERMCQLQIKSHHLDYETTSFLEGFLESEEKLEIAAIRLSDYYNLVQVDVDNIPSWIIEDNVPPCPY